MSRFCSLFSSSSGNCTYIGTARDGILIDAGASAKKICEALTSRDVTPETLRAIFVTHEHTDHISALDVMSKKHPAPIHITEPSARELCRKCAAAECAVIHRGFFFEVEVGDLTVRSFPLPHDSFAHVGYVITSSDGDSAAVATDMGYPTMEAFNNLGGCRQIVIEANHDVDMLRYGPYPVYLKQRILSNRGHLSNENCADLCSGLAEAGCERFMLAHLSAENNTPEKALCAVRSRLDADGYKNVTVKVAPRACALTL